MGRLLPSSGILRHAQLLPGGGILKSCHADSYYQQPLHFTRTSLFYIFGNNNSALVQLFEHVIANVDGTFYNKKLQIVFSVQYKQCDLKTNIYSAAVTEKQ